MKKVLLLVAAFVLTFTLAGCGEKEEELAALPTSFTDINDVDMYLGRDDVQFVDVRDFDEKMKDGYISGFDAIPLRDYLFDSGVLVKAAATGWAFTAGDVKVEAVMNALFDSEKTIFVMCAAGSRAGYVVAALESLGFDAVNVGGFNNYTGDNKVSGDGEYNLSPLPTGDYTPGVYFGEFEGYLAVVTIGARGAITNVAFDAIYCSDDTAATCTSKQALGDAYGMFENPSGFGSDNYEWYEEANIMAAAVLANQGWSADWTLEVDEDHLKLVDPTVVVADGVAGVSIGVEGFQGSLADALSQAMPAS